ncbi:complement factor B-like [Centropristis striata]|uniref:complement factor B-like n=1 Tax=Centropristis striata TaxID=184440 RepID=UPI0027E0F24E|nr:complement factor B-like [Centropristis striata]
MGSPVCWRWIAVLSCLLCMGGEVRCDCTNERLDMEGGTYTLTKELHSNSIVVYQCPEGYYPSPHMTRTCQGSTWNPAPRRSQKCKLVECPDPNVLEHGSVLPPQPKYFVDNETTFECYSGYRLQGSDRRVCLPNGKWSGSTPICSHDSGSTCPDPGIPPGASRTGNIFDVDDTVKYSCNNNMILVGSKERVCQENGQWTGYEPACYYQHTYDTSMEVSLAFGGAIKNSLTILNPEDDIQGTRKIRISKNGVLNIYIAVDISESLKKEHIKNATDAVTALIDKISSFSVTPNYEIVFFSSEIHEVVNIMDFFEPGGVNDIIQRVNNFEISEDINKGTDLNAVFVKFLEKMALIKVRVKEEPFKEHRHCIIVFTDGAYNMGGSPGSTVEKIKKMVYVDHTVGQSLEEQPRKDYLDIYVFAIGLEIIDDDLKPLTVGTGGAHYFRMKEIKNLKETFYDIINEDDVVGLCGLHREFENTERDSKRKRFPWWAAITVKDPNTGKLRNCLGSLVSPRFVLTAAHCFTFEDLSENIKVEIEDGTNREHNVTRHIFHPNFNLTLHKKQNVSEFYDYDVALLQLGGDVQISNIARPICIPCTKETNEALKLRPDATCEQQEQELLLTGKEEVLHFLRKQGTSVIEKTARAKLGPNRAACIQHALEAPGIETKDISLVVTNNFLCTGGLQPQRDDISCKGDSGGAVFKDHSHRTIQLAVVSWGNKDLCAKGFSESDETSRDFHINLFRVFDFLKNVLGNTDQTDFAPLLFLER